jgi:hypothetical protein
MSRPFRLVHRAAPEPPAAGHIIEPMLTIADLTKLLKCTRRLIERYRSLGKLPEPSLMLGRCPRWSPGTIRAWIANGGQTSATEGRR